jgi:uncharacterized membrane protein YkvA (DUF1232 family)
MNRFQTFLKSNWLFIASIIYLIIPTDLIPDFIPLLGKVDDTSLLILDLVKRYVDSRKTNEKD